MSLFVVCCLLFVAVVSVVRLVYCVSCVLVVGLGCLLCVVVVVKGLFVVVCRSQLWLVVVCRLLLFGDCWRLQFGVDCILLLNVVCCLSCVMS